jgi:hypothetical protein
MGEGVLFAKEEEGRKYEETKEHGYHGHFSLNTESRKITALPGG